VVQSKSKAGTLVVCACVIMMMLLIYNMYDFCDCYEREVMPGRAAMWH
jgi:hypothetical protein